MFNNCPKCGREMMTGGCPVCTQTITTYGAPLPPPVLLHVCCWHSTNRTLTVNPPIHVERCCHCGDERHNHARQTFAVPNGHGPYHPTTF